MTISHNPPQKPAEFGASSIFRLLNFDLNLRLLPGFPLSHMGCLKSIQSEDPGRLRVYSVEREKCPPSALSTLQVLIEKMKMQEGVICV